MDAPIVRNIVEASKRDTAKPITTNRKKDSRETRKSPIRFVKPSSSMHMQRWDCRIFAVQRTGQHNGKPHTI